MCYKVGFMLRGVLPAISRRTRNSDWYELQVLVVEVARGKDAEFEVRVSFFLA